MKPMIRRQCAFYYGAPYDAPLRPWVVGRTTNALRVRGTCSFSRRTPPPQTRARPRNTPCSVSIASLSLPGSATQNGPISRDTSSFPPVKDPRSRTEIPTPNQNLGHHKQMSQSSEYSRLAEFAKGIDETAIDARRVYRATGHDTSQSPFHPSPRLQMQSLSTSSHESSAMQHSAVTGSSVSSNAATAGQNGDGAPENDNSSQGATRAIQNEGAPSSAFRTDIDSARSNTNEEDNLATPESDAMATEEEYVPLAFQIPPDAMSAALEAPEQTKASYWSHKLYRGPNDEVIPTHYCTTLEMSERVAKRFLDAKVLGFDIEWKIKAMRHSKKENASLIQIASADRIALFHVAVFAGSRLEQLVPPTLKKILESPDILKVGVAVKGDFTRLKTYLDIHAKGVVELSRLHNLIEVFPDKPDMKLKKLALQVQEHLRLPLYKGEPLLDDLEPEDDAEKLEWLKRQEVRTSDWSEKLEYDQISYAAADAYAGVRLYDVLEFKRKQLDPIPPPPRLCDDDPPTKPRSAPKPRVKKTSDDIVVEALMGMSTGETQEEDSQEYETAAEELEIESEGKEDTDGSEDSDGATDPDADYVPRPSELADTSEGTERVERSSRVRTRYVGRLNLSKMKEADPGYPVLPELSAEETSDSEQLDDAESIAQSSSQPDITETTSAELSDPDVVMHDEETDEYSDPELEQALMDVEINAGEDQTNPQPAPLQQEVPNEEPKPELYSPPSEPPTPYNLATAWARTYLESTIPLATHNPQPPQTSRVRATVPHLRAYHMWHVQHLSADSIGPLLRDPPLAQSTVANYILQAVSLEKLEYDEGKIADLLRKLPVGLRARWKVLGERVGA